MFPYTLGLVQLSHNTRAWELPCYSRYTLSCTSHLSPGADDLLLKEECDLFAISTTSTLSDTVPSQLVRQVQQPDSVCRELITLIKEGQPNHNSNQPDHLHCYWPFGQNFSSKLMLLLRHLECSFPHLCRIQLWIAYMQVAKASPRRPS